MIVYHGSTQHGLQIIQPRISAHGHPYVYAVRNRVFAMLFLGKWNDFILTLTTENHHKVEITERYSHAFEDVYRKQSGTIYTLDSAQFIYLDGSPVNQSDTKYNTEVVSTNPQIVQSEHYIPDIYHALMKINGGDDFQLYQYPHRPPCIPVDNIDLAHSAIRIYENTGDLQVMEYCMRLHPHTEGILKGYLNARP